MASLYLNIEIWLVFLVTHSQIAHKHMYKELFFIVLQALCSLQSYHLFHWASPPPSSTIQPHSWGNYETVQCMVSLLYVRKIDGLMLKLCFTLVLFFIISCM